MQPTIEESGLDSEMKSQERFDEKNCINLERYRNLVRTYIDLRRYRTALFWAEKAVVLSDYQAKDIYWWAQCMFLLREYHRAVHIIKLYGLEKTNIFCHHLIVECLYEAKEYTEAIDLMNSIDLEYLSNSILNIDNTNVNDDTALQILATVDIDDIGPTKSEVISAIYFLKGKILESMENRNMAMNCYIEALHLDVYCTEALDALVQHEMLLASEEQELITHLPFDSQCTENERQIVEKLYKSKLKKYHESTLSHTSNNPNQTPSQNFDSVATIKAILEQSEKTRTERTNTELKLGAKDAPKFFTPATGHVRTPSPPNKFAQDLKATSLYSRLNKHESLLDGSIVNITPLQSNRTATSQTKSKRKIQKNSPETKPCTSVSADISFDRLNKSIDIVTERAAHLFYNGEYKNSISILNEILKNDPYHCPALIILIGCLIELKEYSKLFCIAHKLVDLYSDQAISWYAVGCYYDLIGKSDPARRYLSKATSIDRLFGPAWLAYGHSFAKENEHDQAMAAYFKATQLMRGCHLPLLYIGVECGLTKNYDLSQKFFYQAMSIAPLDVFVLHELGVIKFEYEHFDEAEEILRITLEMVTKMAEKNEEPISIRWEPLINNLGHCCRKNKKYDEALKYHKQALSLKPQNSATYTAIGFVYALKSNLEQAVDYLHRSLALKRDDIVTTALLKSCLEDLMNEDSLPKSLSDSQVDHDVDGFSSVHKRETKSKHHVNYAVKPSCMKINFDDDSNQSQGSDLIDLDMSMD